MTERAPLDELDLRDVKDDLTQRVTDQQKAFGMVPDVGAAERFIDPIIEKINRDQDNLIRREPLKPKPRRPDKEGVEVSHGPAVATVDFATEQAQVHRPDMLMRRNREMTVQEEAIRGALQAMRVNPALEAWKRRIQSIYDKPLPNGHSISACAPCGGGQCVLRENAFRVVITAFFEQFGDPRPRIIASRRRRAQLAAATVKVP